MSKEIERLDISLDGIGHALSDRHLTVPIYQRSYAWEEKQVTDLLKDILSSIRNAELEYFIGSIVISNSTQASEVVDGQQRLATVSILIAAIRDYFLTEKEEGRAHDIQNKYLAIRDIRTQEISPKLRLNASDHDFYYKAIIQKDKSMKPSRESHQRLQKAYDQAKKHVFDYSKHINNPATAILDLLEFIDNRLRVILVQVPSHANAFTIFETLNDRGLELAISDLLKNYLFGQSSDRIAEVQRHWTEMYSLLESTENAALIVTFIRHYWSSIYGLTRERVLYDEIKKRITSKQRAVDLAVNLAKQSKTYTAIIDSNNTYWSEHTIETKTYIATLNLFGMVQVRPLLLSILSNFRKGEKEKAIKFLVSTSVRFLIHGGLGGGALETEYSERAKQISEGMISTAKQLMEKMKPAIPSDSEFYESFKVASVSKQYLARYYLMVLEEVRRGNVTPEFIPNPDATAVNLEHVLPRNPDKGWKIDEDKVRLLHNRLGNLALLSSRINSTAANLPFDNKKKHYEKSDFILTKELKQYQRWDEETIVKRQEVLAKLALKAWPIKI